MIPTYARRKPYVDIFHKRLNSIKDNIQSTIEDACQTNKGQSICFLDSRTTMLSDSCVEIDVHMKKIHTNRYLDFASYNPMQNKEVVVKTLLHGSGLLPSHSETSKNEWERVLTDLKADGYPDRLFNPRTYRQTHAPTVVQGEGVVGSPLAFWLRYAILKRFNL